MFISNAVKEEIGEGDPEAAKLRLKAIEDVFVLPFISIVNILTDTFLISGAVPQNARQDAEHIAYAVAHRMDFLLTWNQKHIANPVKRSQIDEIVRGFKFKPPVILTPEQLLLNEDMTKEEQL